MVKTQLSEEDMRKIYSMKGLAPVVEICKKYSIGPARVNKIWANGHGLADEPDSVNSTNGSTNGSANDHKNGSNDRMNGPANGSTNGVLPAIGEIKNILSEIVEKMDKMKNSIDFAIDKRQY